MFLVSGKVRGWAAITSLGALLWIVVSWHTVSWMSWIAGVSVATAGWVQWQLLQDRRAQRRELQEERSVHLEWRMKVEEIRDQASRHIDGLNHEVHKLQQKVVSSDARCHSYQQLVELHHREIENMARKNRMLVEQLTETEKRLSRITMTRLQPDLFTRKIS